MAMFRIIPFSSIGHEKDIVLDPTDAGRPVTRSWTQTLFPQSIRQRHTSLGRTIRCVLLQRPILLPHDELSTFDGPGDAGKRFLDRSERL
jgi:hypothetical protein